MSVNDRFAERDGRSLGELFSELTDETRTLMRQELELARVELSEKASRAGSSVGQIGIGGAIAYVGAILMAIGLAWLLAEVMPLWLAGLIVGAVLGIVGYVLIQSGLNTLRRMDFTLERTSESLKEDKQWIKEEVR